MGQEFVIFPLQVEGLIKTLLCITLIYKKNITGLDNVAAEGADAFEKMLRVLSQIKQKDATLSDRIDLVCKNLRNGKIYIKGEYKTNCMNLESDVPDHCRKYALSDPKFIEFQVIILELFF